MDWTRHILDVYWELRPCEETQDLYKSKGLLPFDYWRYELEYLTKSTWAKDESMPSYLLEKYRDDEKIRLDDSDRLRLARAFVMDLGMIPDCFDFRSVHL